MTKIVPPDEENFGLKKMNRIFVLLQNLALEVRTGNFRESLRDIYKWIWRSDRKENVAPEEKIVENK